jgi:CubicO group peptidase (beta-lactamase class C family)
LKAEAPFSLGFLRPGRKNPFAHPSAFGGPGTGGALGFADPEAQLGYAYFPNRMGAGLVDPRERALRAAVYRSIGETDPALVRGRSLRRGLRGPGRKGKPARPAHA